MAIVKCSKSMSESYVDGGIEANPKIVGELNLIPPFGYRYFKGKVS